MAIATEPTDQPPPLAVVTSRLRTGLGTFIAIDAEAPGREMSERAIRAAYEAIEDVDRLLHPTRAGAEVAAINAARPMAVVRVHEWTWSVLDLSKRLHRLSKGAFDPCVPPEGTLADLELLEPSPGRVHRVMIHRRMTLDLGGIGKGFAVDRAIAALRAAGCRGGLVNAGGDLAVFGDRAHGVLCRDRHGGVSTVSLRNAALAASDVDADADARPGEHRGYYDGADRRSILSGRAAVVAPSAAVADGLTKCLLAGTADDEGLLAAFAARRIGW